MRYSSLLVAAAASAVYASSSSFSSSAFPSFGLYGLDAQVGLIMQYNNGTSTPIGPPLPTSDLQAQQLSCIDEKNGILYAILYNDQTNKPMFTGISLSTGAVVSSVPVPFAESSFVGVGQLMAWEPGSAQLLAGGQLANLSHVIGVVDPKSGAWTQLAMLNSSYIDVLGGAAAFAVDSNSLLFQLGVDGGNAINIFTLNVKTGAIAQFPQEFSNGANIETMDYDPLTGSVFGLGIEPSGSTFIRTVTALHPNNMTISVVGKVEDFSIESGGIAAINVAARSIYWIGEKAGGTGAQPFYLVQSSILTGKTITSSSVPLCTNDPGCPWSLEMLNAKF